MKKAILEYLNSDHLTSLGITYPLEEIISLEGSEREEIITKTRVLYKNHDWRAPMIAADLSIEDICARFLSDINSKLNRLIRSDFTCEVAFALWHHSKNPVGLDYLTMGATGNGFSNWSKCVLLLGQTGDIRAAKLLLELAKTVSRKKLPTVLSALEQVSSLNPRSPLHLSQEQIRDMSKKDWLDRRQSSLIAKK